MHELAVAQSIVDIVVSKAQARRVTAVNIVLGDLVCVAEEPIRFCFSLAARDTIAEDAVLSVVRIPALLRCRRCRNEFALEARGACPFCGTGNGEIIHGRECYIDTIEVAETG